MTDPMTGMTSAELDPRIDQIGEQWNNAYTSKEGLKDFAQNARFNMGYLLNEVARLTAALESEQKRAEAAEAREKENAVILAIYKQGGCVTIGTDNAKGAENEG